MHMKTSTCLYVPQSTPTQSAHEGSIVNPMECQPDNWDLDCTFIQKNLLSDFLPTNFSNHARLTTIFIYTFFNHSSSFHRGITELDIIFLHNMRQNFEFLAHQKI